MIDNLECAELAAHLLGMGDDWEEWDVWNRLYAEHEIDEDGFCWLINRLVPMIDIAESPMTGTAYKGFSKLLKPGLSEWLAKTECPEFGNIIKNLIPKYLISEVKEGSNGYTFEIIKKGDAPEKYLVTVERVKEGSE